MALFAGAATVDITPAPGLMMGGYGARTNPAEGAHDPLLARTLVLSDGRVDVAIVVCDLLGTPRYFVDEVRRHADKLGFLGDAVLVAGTHTHSGPGVVYSRRLNDYLRDTAVTVASSIDEARSRLRPAVLRARSIEMDTISQNRRNPENPVEREAQVLALASADDGSPIATIVNYACHATVLEHDNLLWSADFPGAACQLIEAALGGVAIYLQGCCGDINPLWVRHDFTETERIGGIVGAATAKAVHELTPLGTSGQFAINLSWSEEVRQDPACGRLIDDIKLSSRSVPVELRRRDLRSLDELEPEIAELEQRLEGLSPGDEQRRAITQRLNQLTMERTVQNFKQLQPSEQEITEVQVIVIGEGCALVSLPGEFFVETARMIRNDSGIEHLLIAGYANDYIGYVPPAHEFANGGYEVGFARFDSESEGLIRTAAVDTLQQSVARAEP